jgi:hypothetical protein
LAAAWAVDEVDELELEDVVLTWLCEKIEAVG